MCLPSIEQVIYSKMESDRSGINEVFQKIEKVEQGIQDYNEQKT